MKPLQFRVRWEWITGEKGIAEESSWYLLTQRGELLTANPMRPIGNVDLADYKELTPLIKIHNEWLSVEEIEKKITRLQMDNLSDGLVEDIINTSDEEILKEVEEDYGDSEYLASKAKDILNRCKNK